MPPPLFFCTHGAPPESVKNCFCPFKSAKKRRTGHSCTNRRLSSTERFCYQSYFGVREIPPQTNAWGDNLALALPWVAGYRSYKSYKSYRHWLVMTLTSVASARRGWLMAPLPLPQFAILAARRSCELLRCRRSTALGAKHLRRWLASTTVYICFC